MDKNANNCMFNKQWTDRTHFIFNDYDSAIEPTCQHLYTMISKIKSTFLLKQELEGLRLLTSTAKPLIVDLSTL